MGLAVGALFAAGCGGDSPVVYQAPVHPRATLVLEPPTIRVGDVAVLEIAVITPPEHHVRPFPTPEEVDGFWILQSELLPVTREPNRWIHRKRVRIRAREVGDFAWPAGEVEVDVPDGDVHTLALDGLALEVVSVLPEHPGQLAPYGLGPILAQPSATPGFAWAAAGAGATLAVLGLVWLARRGGAGAADAGEAVAREGPTAWETALTAFATARERLDGDLLAASQLASVSLCRYMAERYGAHAPARTTPELETTTPPFAATSRWPVFVAILRGLDGVRFPAPSADAEDARARVAALLEDAERFVRDTIPHESLR